MHNPPPPINLQHFKEPAAVGVYICNVNKRRQSVARHLRLFARKVIVGCHGSLAWLIFVISIWLCTTRQLRVKLCIILGHLSSSSITSYIFLIVYFLLSSSFLPEKVELATLAPDGDSSVQNRNGLTPVSYITRTLPQGKECQRRQEGWVAGRGRVANRVSFEEGCTWRGDFQKRRCLQLQLLLLPQEPLWIAIREILPR